ATVSTPLVAFGLISLLLLILSAYTSISGLFKAELFPAHIRNLGVALPYAIGNALFGGTSEYVALSFKTAGAEYGFYWYVAALIGITCVTFVTLPNVRRAAL
ncbi:MAG TPA: alpha-ketoglutarate permease, partial [Sphingomicrobium sp.]